MQSQIKTLKAEKSYRRQAPHSNLELYAILNQEWEPQNRIICRAVNISLNQPIREGYLKSGTGHLNS